MTANPNQGWRTVPRPGSRLERTEAGRYALPMVITYNGEVKGHSTHTFTGEDIESLYRQMRALFADSAGGPAPNIPDRLDGDPPYEDRRGLKFEMGRIV